MLTGETKWTWFTVVSPLGYVDDNCDIFLLHCIVCDHEFVIDTLYHPNMCEVFEGWVPECPNCNQLGVT